MLPCGRSAHLELGYAIGKRKRAVVWFPTEADELIGEPELMYKLCERAYTMIELVRVVRQWEQRP